MSFFWNYSRFAFARPGSGGGSRGGGGAPGSESGSPTAPESADGAAERRARERVRRREAEQQLEDLKDEIHSDKSSLILLAQALRGERLHQWLEPETDKKMVAAKIREAFNDLKKGDPKFQEPEGLQKLLDGLRDDPASDFHKNALRALEDFVNLIDATNRETPKTSEALRGLKEDVPTMKVEECVGNMAEKFRRGSGTEKLLMVGSLGLAAYFIWNTPKLKRLFGIGGGIFALNYLVGVASGKSIFERFGLMSTLDQLPSQMKAFAEKIGMKNPEQVLGMARLAPIEIDRLYRAYSNARNGEIDPRSFGLMDKELKPTELYEIIDELVKQAGGREDFRRKYTGEKLKFLQVVLALNGEGSLTELAGIMPNEKEKWIADLRKIFEGRKGFSIEPGEELFVKMATFTLPGIQRDTDMKSENPYYIFRFEDGTSVKMFLKDSAAERTNQIARLETLMQKKLMKEVADMKFVQGSVVFRNGEWVIPNVTVKGKKFDLTLKGGKDHTIEYYIGNERLPYADGGIEQAYEKFALLEQLRRQFPVLMGVDVEITAISGNAGNRKLKTSVAGVFFEMLELPGGQFQISADDQKNILQSSSFQAKKQRAFQEELSSILGESHLRKIAKDINEEWGPTFKLEFPFVFHGSGSFSEALWNAGVDTKIQNITDLYLYTLSHPANMGNGLAESGQAEKQFITEVRAQAETLYRELEDLVSKDKEVDKKDFKGLFDRLITFGISNGEVRQNVTRVAQRFLKEVNHEGIDQSDILTGWTKTHKILLETYLSAIAPISRKSALSARDKEFLKAVEEKMFKKIGLFTRKSDGILWTDIHESLNPGDIAQWEIPSYEDFVAGRGGAGSGGASGLDTGGGERLAEGATKPEVGMKVFSDQSDDARFAADDIDVARSNLKREGVMKQMNWVVLHEFDVASADPKNSDKKFETALLTRGHAMLKIGGTSSEYETELNKILYVDADPKKSTRVFQEQIDHLQAYRRYVKRQFYDVLGGPAP